MSRAQIYTARGYRPKPKTIPKLIRRGRYRAVLVGTSRGAHWEIRLGRKHVGDMYEGGSWPWGQPHYALTRLVWTGKFPQDCSDPRSKNYGICFDGVGFASREDCLDAFAKAAERLMAWREKNP